MVLCAVEAKSLPWDRGFIFGKSHISCITKYMNKKVMLSGKNIYEKIMKPVLLFESLIDSEGTLFI